MSKEAVSAAECRLRYREAPGVTYLHTVKEWYRQFRDGDITSKFAPVLKVAVVQNDLTFY